MFEDKTYESLLAEALSYAPAGIDTRQGSIYRDALTGPILALAQFYADLDNLISLTRIDTAAEEYLDDKGVEYAVERQAAVCATYAAVIEGTPPNEGEEFIIGDLFFDIFYDDDGDPIIAGANAQSDDDYRERIQESISGPAENGNKQHYKTWCESVEGVGHAKIVPLWNGPNTVKGIIYAEDGTPASATIIARVQNYIDPDDDNDGEGDGLGEGVAEIGAHFTAVAPSTLNLTVAATLTLASGYTIEMVQDDLEEAIENYLKNAVIENDDDVTEPIIRYNAIGAIFLDSEGVIDYSNLTLNGGTGNIQPDDDEVVVLNSLTITSA